MNGGCRHRWYSLAWIAVVGLVAFGQLLGDAHGFDLRSLPPAKRLIMNLDLFPTSQFETLGYGLQSWSSLAEGALASWNEIGVGSPADHAFFAVKALTVTGNACSLDGINEVRFSSTICGMGWGDSLGYTTSRFFIGGNVVEADVIFNAGVFFDAYPGPRLYLGGEPLEDFYRVAVHEFGHALGLDHPDEAGQAVSAVMNSNISDVDSQRADDIAGAHAVQWSDPAAVIVSVAATDSVATEAGLTTGTFTFTRTGNTTGALTVTYTVGGTATSGVDYTALGTSITFAPGQPTVTKTVTPLQDGIQEPNETIIVTLMASPFYVVGAPSATVTLTSDQVGTQTVSVAATDGVATEAGLTPGTFTFTRTGNTTVPLTVTYTVGGTATPGVDYAALGTTVAFAAGQTTATKIVTPLQDALQEPNETIIVTLAGSPNYAVGTPSAIVTLTSDEVVTQTVSVAATDSVATEAGLTTGTFTFTRTGNTTGPLTVTYAVGGTATPGADYAALGTTVAFAAGQTTATKIVTPLQDALQEPNETIIVTLAGSPNYAVGTPSATVTLTSDEVITQTVSVAATDSVATEAGLTTGTFTFTRTGNTIGPLTVTYTVAGTATSGVDYAALGSTVVFPAGQTTATKIVTPFQDAVQEANETIMVTLVASPNYAVGTPSATVILTSDEVVTQTVSVTATDSIATEAGLTPGTFTFTRTGNTTGPLTVTYAVGGTATSSVDYAALGSTVAFAAGQTTATKIVTSLQDALQESNETIIVTLVASQNYALGTPSATVILTSDEVVTQTVSVTATDSIATEAGLTTGTFTFTRTGNTTGPLTVTYAVGGTATQGADYAALGSTVAFAAGQTTATKVVTPLQDVLQESNETIIVTLVASPNYALGTPSATVTFTSDD